MDWQVKKYPMYYKGVKQRYSKSAVVGNLIFCSGMDSATLETGQVSSDDVAEQMVVALDKLKGALREAGGTMDNIVKTAIFLRDMKDYARMREVELEYYRKHATLLVDEPPASSVLQPQSLVRPESLIEIDAIGVISRDKPGWEVKKYPMYYGGVKQRYSKSTVVGNLIFCSGMDGATLETGEVSSDDMPEQMVVALDKLKGALREAGGTMNNIADTLIFLRDLKEYSRMRETEVAYYQKHATLLVDEAPTGFFAQTFLAKPENLVQIDAIAVVSPEEPGWKLKKYPLYYRGVKQTYPNTPARHTHTSKAAVVGNLVIGTGMSARTPETEEIFTHDMAEQTLVVLGKVKDMLEEVGSSMNNIVKTFILLPGMKEYSRMREAELDFYRKHAPLLVDEPPASTVIQPRGLTTPTILNLIELDVIAVIPGKNS